ncbi:MAG: hypothetical protein H6832_14415 [Planctomycetes bacterium]|nr:hypothetical protein [Planctomycetota bacterium]
MTAQWIFASMLALAGVSGGSLPGQGTVPVAPPRLSPRATEVWDYSRTQVIERMVERLRGATSLEAWRFSKLALARCCDDEEVRATLVRYLEKNLLTRGEDAPARNAMEVMRRSKRTEFSPALMRASEHGIRQISEDAISALESCADETAVQSLLRSFATRYLRAQVLVLRVIANRGSAEVAVPFLRKLLDGQVILQDLPTLTAAVLETFDHGAPPAVVRGTLAGKLRLFPNSAGELAAKLLHKAGDDEGRFALLRMLEQQEDPVRRGGLVESLALRDAAASLDEVLALVADSKDAAPRLALARFLAAIPDGSDKEESVVAMLEVLANDDVRDVELAALAALRGRSKPVTDRLVSLLQTADGSQLRIVLQSLIEAADPRAVPAIAARLEKAEGRDRQIYVQALGRMGTKASLPYLAEVLTGSSIDFGRDVDSVAYAAIVTTNILEAEPALWRVYESMPTDTSQGLAVRSHVLKTLANLAKAPGEDESARLERIHERFRDILFDPKQPASERLLCLDYLRGGTLGIDDALRLGRRMRRDDSFAPDELLGRFNDFLTEYF